MRDHSFRRIMGLVLHFSYLMTRSLWIPVLLHFLNNSASVAAGKLGDESSDQATAASPWYLYGAALLLAGAVAWGCPNG